MRDCAFELQKFSIAMDLRGAVPVSWTHQAGLNGEAQSFQVIPVAGKHLYPVALTFPRQRVHS